MANPFRRIERVPIVETERLILRAHRVDDLAQSAAMWGDPAVTRYIGGKPSTREEVWGRLLRYAGLWSLLGFGYWAIEERATGDFAGELGFADFQRAIEPSLEGIPELGWAIVPRLQGNGYATEAVRAAHAWGDVRFASGLTAALIHPENVASIRVAAKTGYRQTCRTTYRDVPTLIFAR